MKQHYQRPVLSDELQDRISDAVQAFTNRGKWREWGLDKLREQGAAILFHGPPGVGKTITAYYVGKRLHLGIREISMADYGSHVPGELARNIKRIFKGEQLIAKQKRRQPPVMFLDECDAMIVSRKKLGMDMMWMLEPINALLTEISKYPGLVILATNMVPMLDEALERRLIARVLFTRPERAERVKIWKVKWPIKFPCQPTEAELLTLSEFSLTGAQIENAFLLWAGRNLRTNQQPTVGELINFLHKEWQQYFS
ncbi:MAG TPA: AAA family ATPase [Bacteroidia bacterium]|nr:AAA family ATPase [Bacteroidia bacterium]